MPLSSSLEKPQAAASSRRRCPRPEHHFQASLPVTLSSLRSLLIPHRPALSALRGLCSSKVQVLKGFRCSRRECSGSFDLGYSGFGGREVETRRPPLYTVHGFLQWPIVDKAKLQGIFRAGSRTHLERATKRTGPLKGSSDGSQGGVTVQSKKESRLQTTALLNLTPPNAPIGRKCSPFSSGYLACWKLSRRRQCVSGEPLESRQRRRVHTNGDRSAGLKTCPRAERRPKGRGERVNSALGADATALVRADPL